MINKEPVRQPLNDLFGTQYPDSYLNDLFGIQYADSYKSTTTLNCNNRLYFSGCRTSSEKMQCEKCLSRSRIMFITREGRLCEKCNDNYRACQTTH
jgi:hypothetical protein